MKRFFPLILGVLSLYIPFQGFSEEKADSTDLVAIFNEMLGLSQADQYFDKLGREHPLLNASTMDYQAIVDSATVVLDIFPNDSYSIKWRSYGRYGVGDYDGAVKDALKILCESDEYDVSQSILNYIETIDPALVLRNLRPYVAVYLENPNPATADECLKSYLNRTAMLESKTGNMKEGYNVVKKAADIKVEDDISSEILQSTLLILSGYPEMAVELLRPYVGDINNAEYSAVVNYTQALNQTGKKKEAYKIFDKVLSSKALDANYKKYAKMNYAIMLAANGDYKKAIKMFDALIKESDQTMLLEELENPPFNDLLNEYILRKGITYIKDGKVKEGRSLVQLALDNVLQLEEPIGYEAVAYAYLGEKEKALEWVDKFEWYGDTNKAAVYAVLGDYDTALSYLKKALDTYRTAPAQLEYDINFTELRKHPSYQQLIKGFKPADL